MDNNYNKYIYNNTNLKITGLDKKYEKVFVLLSNNQMNAQNCIGELKNRLGDIGGIAIENLIDTIYTDITEENVLDIEKYVNTIIQDIDSNQIDSMFKQILTNGKDSF